MGKQKSKKLCEFDFDNDKKLRLSCLGIAAGICAVLFLIGILIQPLRELFDTAGILRFGLRMVLLLALLLLLVASCELLRSALIKKLSGKEAQHSIRRPFAYAYTHEKLNVRQYLIISLAPTIICALVIVLLQLLLPDKWFWVLMVVQMANLGGAAPAVYSTVVVLKIQAGVLLSDDGEKLTVWTN